MKKLLCLLFASLIIFSVFAIDNTYDTTFSLGYVNVKNDNASTNNNYSSEYKLTTFGAGLDLFWNPVPVGFYARIEPMVLIEYDRTCWNHTEKGLMALNSSDLSLVEELGAIYALELADNLYLDLAAAFSFIGVMGSNPDDADRVRFDSILGLGFTADANIKCVLNKFIITAGVKGSIYPALETTAIDSKYSYSTYEDSTFGYAIRPYVALGFRIRHIRIK